MIDERPTIDQTLLEIARVMARRGTCSRAQVGAIIARDGRVLASGHNGAPRGMPHCVHPPHERSDDLPDGVPPCSYSVHAEANAVAFAARYGVALDGATLYTTLTPCVTCAQLVINAGIDRVIAGQAYRFPDGAILLDQADVAVFYLDAATGGLRTTS